MAKFRSFRSCQDRKWHTARKGFTGHRCPLECCPGNNHSTVPFPAALLITLSECVCVCAREGSQSKQRCAKTIKSEGTSVPDRGMGGRGACKCSSFMGINGAGRQLLHADLQGTERHYQTAMAEIRSIQIPDRELIKTSRRHQSVSARTHTRTYTRTYTHTRHMHIHVLINDRGRRKVITLVCISGSDYCSGSKAKPLGLRLLLFLTTTPPFRLQPILSVVQDGSERQTSVSTASFGPANQISVGIAFTTAMYSSDLCASVSAM